MGSFRPPIGGHRLNQVDKNQSDYCGGAEYISLCEYRTRYPLILFLWIVTARSVIVYTGKCLGYYYVRVWRREGGSRLGCCLVVRLVARSVCWLIGWSVGWLVGLLVGWSVGLLVGRSADW